MDSSMTQPEALRLADLLEPCCLTIGDAQQAVAAAELRRLHAELERCKQVCAATSESWRTDAEKWKGQRDALLEALKTVEWHGQGSCWVVDADKIAAAIKAAEENT